MLRRNVREISAVINWFIVCMAGLLVLTCTFSGVSQTTKIESIKALLARSGDRDSLKIIMNLLKEKNSMPGDTINKYLLLADVLAERTADDSVKFMLNYYKAIKIQNESDIDSALEICNRNITELKGSGLGPDHLLRFMHLKASLLVRAGQLEEGMNTYYLTLEKAEKVQSLDYQLAGKNGIGWVFMEKNDYEQALKWFRKAIATTSNEEELKKFTVILLNMAATFNSLNKNDSAIFYIEKAIRYARESEDLRSLANGLAIKADILIDLKRQDEAEGVLNDAIETRKKIGDIYYVVSDMYQLGIFYASVGNCEKGIEVCKEGLRLAEEHHVDSKVMILYEALAKNYKFCNDMNAYAATLEKIISRKDSINRTVSVKTLNEVAAKYELEKKEAQIVRQNLLLSRRNYIIYGSLTLFILLAIIGIQYFYQYRNRQENGALLGMSKAREEERARIAADLHDNIGTQLSYISRKIEMAGSQEKADSGKVLHFLNDIDEAARKTIADLRETIWTMKKEKVGMKELADRLKVFAQHQVGSAPGLKLEINEDFEKDLLLTSIDSINIYRILQEAINNACRHAKGTTIFLEFITEMNGNWRATVRDDGTGFSLMQTFDEHYGLENMKQRARDIGIGLLVDSSENEGTEITLSGNGKT